LDAALQYLTCGNNNNNNNNGNNNNDNNNNNDINDNNNNDINKNTWDEDEPSFKIVTFSKYTALILRVYIVELNAFCGANVIRQITGGYCDVFIVSNNVSAV